MFSICRRRELQWALELKLELKLDLKLELKLEKPWLPSEKDLPHLISPVLVTHDNSELGHWGSGNPLTLMKSIIAAWGIDHCVNGNWKLVRGFEEN